MLIRFPPRCLIAQAATNALTAIPPAWQRGESSLACGQTAPDQVACARKSQTVWGMLYQASSGLRQPLLQAGERPIADRVGQ
jgi:hypothetical protein